MLESIDFKVLLWSERKKQTVFLDKRVGENEKRQ